MSDDIVTGTRTKRPERHEQGCLYGTYNPSTHDTYTHCSCGSKKPSLGALELIHANAELSKQIEKLKEERDHYQSEFQRVNELLGQMTAAATSAAATTVTAIERLQEMEKIVKAAEDWVVGGSHSALVDAVTAWLKFKRTWS